MHTLLLATRVNWHDTRVNDDNDADDLVLLLNDGTCHQRDDIGSLVLSQLKLNDSHQQVAPREYRTDTATSHMYTLYTSFKSFTENDAHQLDTNNLPDYYC